MKQNMTLGKFLDIMKPTKPFEVKCGEASATFIDKEDVPDVLLCAELKKNRKDSLTGCIVFEVEDGEHE